MPLKREREVSMQLWIENGCLTDPASGREEICDILVEDGKIAAIGRGLCESAGRMKTAEKVERIDAAGLRVAPGLVDVHAHFRDPGFTYKEDIISGAKAAASGGYTTVVLMANTRPAVDQPETLQYVLEKGKKTGIHIHSCAAVTRGLGGSELTSMEELKKAGAAGFTDDGIPVLDEAILRSAMEEAHRLHMPVSLHEEDPAYIQNNGINHGRASAYFGIGGSDRQAEISMVERDLRIASETGACVNIQHISSREAVELVRRARKAGADVHAEATPHHFTLTEEDAIRYGTLAKMNPPLREEADRQAIIRGLQDGTIDLIATDHAPHSIEEKERTITEAPSGIIGLETALSLGITELVDKGYLTMLSLLEKFTCNPARMYHLDAGYIAEGGPADLVIFDPQACREAGDHASRSENTPFRGCALKGVVRYTICEGKVVYRNMKKKKTTAVVVSQKEIAADIYDMWLETELAQGARPGQFICLYTHDASALLPRPISICQVDGERERLRIVYRIAGRGTKEFSSYKEGERVDILGCLGNGFPLEEAVGKKVFLMGGGIGIPPMLELARELNAEKQVIVGYRDGQTFLKEDLEQNAAVYVATEDGSVGVKGNVLDAVRENNLQADVIYACGPMPMLRAIKKYAQECGIPAYLSLEERMACGVGACLGCVAKTQKVHHHSHVHNARICTDGPVFEAGEVEI